MKTFQLLWMAGAVAALFANPALAANREIQIRVLNLAGNEFGAELFAHDGKSSRRGVSLIPKTFLNHEFEEVRIGGEELVVTTSPSSSSVGNELAVVARVPVPAGLTSGILLLVTGAEGERIARLLDDTPKVFPSGAFMLVNLCDEKIRLNLAEHEIEVDAGAVSILAEPPDPEEGNARLETFRMRNDKWEKIGGSVWVPPGAGRLVQIAWYNPKAKSIQIRGVKDVAVPE